MEALINDFPLLIFFVHVCAWIYDTEGSDHTAQYISSATAIFWSINNCDHRLSASLQFNYGFTLVDTQFIFLPQLFHQNFFYTTSCVHCLSLTDFIYILEMVKWWLKSEGWANTEYCSIVGDAAELHLLLQKRWILKLSSRQYKVKSL